MENKLSAGEQIYSQLMDAAGELYHAKGQPWYWGCVAPGPEELAWMKMRKIAGQIRDMVDGQNLGWFGLTEGEIEECWNRVTLDSSNTKISFARAIEEKLKDLNR